MTENLLAHLTKTDAYVSGQELSSLLGITRAAVWKKVDALRRRGFVIEAVPSKGYRMVSSPDLAEDYLSARIHGSFWRKVLVVDAVGSTNDFALTRAVEHEIGPGTVVIADRQTAGKGRLGRTWESPPGLNIYSSMVIRPDISPRDATMLTVLAAVAVTQALRETAGVPATIKWPNDLTIDDRKLGGILTEVRADPDRINLAVIGIGINVNMALSDFPPDLRETATSIRIATGSPASRNEIVIGLLKSFAYWLGILGSEGKVPLLAEWRRYASTLGRRVKVVMHDHSFSGTALDLDENGMLLVRADEGDVRRVSAGDIMFLR